METAVFRVEELSGERTARALKRALDTLPGVTSVSISRADECVTIDFDSTGVSRQKIKNKLLDLGFAVGEMVPHGTPFVKGGHHAK